MLKLKFYWQLDCPTLEKIQSRRLSVCSTPSRRCHGRKFSLLLSADVVDLLTLELFVIRGRGGRRQ